LIVPESFFDRYHIRDENIQITVSLKNKNQSLVKILKSGSDNKKLNGFV